MLSTHVDLIAAGAPALPDGYSYKTFVSNQPDRLTEVKVEVFQDRPTWFNPRRTVRVARELTFLELQNWTNPRLTPEAVLVRLARQLAHTIRQEQPSAA